VGKETPMKPMPAVEGPKLRIKESIELNIEGSTVSTPWWSNEIREIFCECCTEEKDCDACENNNPWCG